MNKLKHYFLRQFSLISIIGLLAGGIGGYFYYYFIGCNSGSCAIQSNPFLSILWGALMGYLIFDMIPKRKKEEN